MKIVVKIGTSSLTNDDGVLRHDVVAAIADQISRAKTNRNLLTDGREALEGRFWPNIIPVDLEPVENQLDVV